MKERSKQIRKKNQVRLIYARILSGRTGNNLKNLPEKSKLYLRTFLQKAINPCSKSIYQNNVEAYCSGVFTVDAEMLFVYSARELYKIF